MNSKQLIFTLALALVFLAPPVFAELFDTPGIVYQKIGKGEINWSDGLIRAKGAETFKSTVKNIAVAKLATERSAKISAMRAIYDTLQNVYVDANTTINNFVTASEFIRKQIDRIAGASRIVEKTHSEDGVIEVVVEASIRGPLIEAIILQAGEIELSETGDPIYSGLLIDARGLNIRPAISPLIIDQRGREIYSASVISKKYAAKHGLVSYFGDYDKAIHHPVIGSKPLIIKAAKASGPGNRNIMISNADGQKIRNASSNLSFLKQCRIIIVVD